MNIDLLLQQRRMLLTLQSEIFRGAPSDKLRRALLTRISLTFFGKLGVRFVNTFDCNLRLVLYECSKSLSLRTKNSRNRLKIDGERCVANLGISNVRSR